MSTYAQRLSAALEKSGKSPAQLADAIGRSASAISQVLSGQTKALTAENNARAAVFLGCDPFWLATGEPAPAGNVSAPPSKQVPVISTVQAGMWAEVRDNFHPGEADDWQVVSKKVGRHAFALEIEGDSMEPDFVAGGRIVVDPDQIPASGHFVVAKLIDVQAATFKRLMSDAGRAYLVPLNRAYPTIEVSENVRIIGRVVEYHPPSRSL